MSIVARKISYIHPDNVVLFNQVSLIVNKGEKVAFIGDNGTGKSTFLRILSGEIQPQEGEVISSSLPYYVPQHFGQYDHLSISEVLKVDQKIKALHAITGGDPSIHNFNLLDEDWTIEERCLSALSFWGLEHLKLDQYLCTLSGGEKTKVFLSGIRIHSPAILLLDEPTNHLDRQSREQLYRLLQSSPATILIVSHDRKLLNLLPTLFELTRNGITTYGGNYDFYKEQHELQQNALHAQLYEKEKELRLFRKAAQEMAERKDKHETRGKKANQKKGIPRIVMGNLKNQAEASRSKQNDIQNEKVESIGNDIRQIRSSIPDTQTMKIDFSASGLHKGKILVSAQNVNYRYDGQPWLWENALNFQIKSGDRLVINGRNGSGKTTLLKLITGQLEPTQGTLHRADFTFVYIDQEYSFIQDQATLYEQAQIFNSRNFQEHEIKMLLNRYLFHSGTWNKKCGQLSGGEKMRLMFCCLMIGNQTPDIFILDEPTNNLDIRSIGIITSVMKEYKGTLLLISHDATFIEEIQAGIRSIELY